MMTSAVSLILVSVAMHVACGMHVALVVQGKGSCSHLDGSM